MPPPSQVARYLNTMVLPSLLVSPQGGWPAWPPTARNFLTRPSTGTPGRTMSPDECLPAPRVARAQETNRPHSPLPA